MAKSDKECIEYLKKNSDLFVRHPDLLDDMELPHGSSTVPSLLNKRMQMLEEKNKKLKAEVARYIEIAQVNEKLSFNIYQLGNDLIRLLLRNKELTIHQCIKAIKKQFTDLHINILVYGDEPTDVASNKIKIGEQRIAGIARHVFNERQFSCGPFNAAERAALLGTDAARFRSMLVAGLGGYRKTQPYGLLILASNDEKRFAPGLGTMFLVQLGELVETALGVDRDSAKRT